MESVGCGHRRDQLCKELSRRLRRAGRTARYGQGHPATRKQGAERQIREGQKDLKMGREAGNQVRVGISEPATGHIVVTGELTFASARDARQLGLLVLESSRAARLVIDCGGVTRADSA